MRRKSITADTTEYASDVIGLKKFYESIERKMVKIASFSSSLIQASRKQFTAETRAASPNSMASFAVSHLHDALSFFSFHGANLLLTCHQGKLLCVPEIRIEEDIGSKISNRHSRMKLVG